MNGFQITLIPFLVGAATEFLPVWLMAPAIFLLILHWLGIIGRIIQDREKEEAAKRAKKLDDTIEITRRSY